MDPRNRREVVMCCKGYDDRLMPFKAGDVLEMFYHAHPILTCV